MFIAALFTIARTWKQPRCPSTDERVKKSWYIYTKEFYSAIKKERIWVSSNEVDDTGAYYTEWSKPKRKTPMQYAAAAAAKLLQSCPTLWDPVDGSPPGSPVPGILQARTLEWVAISFSNAWKWKNKVKLLSRVRLLATPWTAAHQAPPSMGFSRQEFWSGLPLPSLFHHLGVYWWNIVREFGIQVGHRV